MEEEELPKAEPRSRNNDMELPAASNDKLINKTKRLPLRRGKEEKEIISNDNNIEEKEQLYSKKNYINNDDKDNGPSNIDNQVKGTVQFMKPNANFIFQTIIEFHRIYSILYFIIEELLFVYKVNYFQFPDVTRGLEISSLVFYLIVQLARLHFGSLGNREEHSLFVIFCLAFSIGALYTYIHFLLLQTFVLRIELITNAIGIAIWLFEAIFSIMAFLAVSKQESSM